MSNSLDLISELVDRAYQVLSKREIPDWRDVLEYIKENDVQEIADFVREHCDWKEIVISHLGVVSTSELADLNPNTYNDYEDVKHLKNVWNQYITKWLFQYFTEDVQDLSFEVESLFESRYGRAAQKEAALSRANPEVA